MSTTSCVKRKHSWKRLEYAFQSMSTCEMKLYDGSLIRQTL